MIGLLKALGEKPWLEQTVAEEINPVQMMPKPVALKFFLGVVSVFFSLFIVTFLARSQYVDFQPLAGDVWQPLYDPTRMVINTAFLLVSCIALQSALFAMKYNKTIMAVYCVGVGLLFGLQFLFAQFFLWQYLQGLGFYVSSNPANSYFYLLTGLHGLHLLGGMLVLSAAFIRLVRKKSLECFTESIRLCAVYWHYMFAVWLVLFALLVSSPETYKALAALCGFG